MPRHLLNIASIVCLVLCVALMRMWVRSYRGCDDLAGPFGAKQILGVTSLAGRMEFISMLLPIPPEPPWHWGIVSRPFATIEDMDEMPTWKRSPSHFGFAYEKPAFGPRLLVPYWFLVLLSGSLAMLCRLRWPLRFTLRSLFVVTTFLAVVLGMIAWLDGAWIRK